jgi:hypothetical protein
MRYFYIILLFILCQFNGFAQETKAKQLRFLLQDLQEYFKQSKGALSNKYSSDTLYLSTLVLEGTKDNEISTATDGITWMAYTAYISDSTSLKDAKKLATDWRKIIQQNAVGYTENEKERKSKSIMGYPLFGYVFEKLEESTKYWISVTYAKGQLESYRVFMMVGRQTW